MPTARLDQADTQSQFAEAISINRPEKRIFEADVSVVFDFAPVHWRGPKERARRAGGFVW